MNTSTTIILPATATHLLHILIKILIEKDKTQKINSGSQEKKNQGQSKDWHSRHDSRVQGATALY